jgi:hypothetical protein
MVRLRTASVFLVVSFFFVLPLYELADVGERWPHDGIYVSVILTALFFIGLTLVLRKMAGIASRNLVAFQASQSGLLGDQGRTVAALTPAARDARLASARTYAEALRLKCPSTLASILDGTGCSRLSILRDFRI